MNLELIQKHLGRVPNKIEQLFFKSFWNSVQKQSRFDFEVSQTEIQSSNNSKLTLVAEGKSDPRMIVADNIIFAENSKKLAAIPSAKGSYVIGISPDITLSQSNTGRQVYFLYGAGLKSIIQELYKHDWFAGSLPVHKYGLGFTLYTYLNENHCGLQMPLKKNDDLHILSKKGVHGLLIFINRRFDNSFQDLINDAKNDCMDMGFITGEPNIELMTGQNPSGHIPLSILEILVRQEQNLDEIKMQTAIPDFSSPKIKKKKNYNNELKKLIDDSNSVVPIQISQKTIKVKGNIAIFKRGKAMFGAAVNDNSYIDYNDYKMKSVAAIANSTRHLVCAGIRPEVCSGFVNLAESNPSENGSFLKGIKDVGQILNISIENLSFEISPDLPQGEFCTVGTSVSDKFFPNTFGSSDLFISMLGSHRGELGGSRYLSLSSQDGTGSRPVVDLMMESRLQDAILTGIQGGLIQSARPVGRGGVAVSIATSFEKNTDLGARIHFSRKLKTEELLFGETQGLVLVTIKESDLMEFERVCMTIGIPATTIGRITNDGLFTFNDSIKFPVNSLN